MLSVGVGPQVPIPWVLAAKNGLKAPVARTITSVDHVEVHLYGSLSLTGKGHATDIAVIMGLMAPIRKPIQLKTFSGIDKLDDSGI